MSGGRRAVRGSRGTTGGVVAGPAVAGPAGPAAGPGGPVGPAAPTTTPTATPAAAPAARGAAAERRRSRREARARKRARRGLLLTSLELASVAYLAAIGGLLWWSNAPLLVGWQPRVVLTGSMLPTIRPGDVALIGPADAHDPLSLPPGRIVLVDDPERESGSYLHRVVRYEDDGRMVTQGDANATEDHPAVTPDRVLGQLRLLVPVAGRPVVWVHEQRYVALGVSLAVTWAAMAFALSLRGRVDPEEADDSTGRRAGGRPAGAARAAGSGAGASAAPSAAVMPAAVLMSPGGAGERRDVPPDEDPTTALAGPGAREPVWPDEDPTTAPTLLPGGPLPGRVVPSLPDALDDLVAPLPGEPSEPSETAGSRPSPNEVLPGAGDVPASGTALRAPGPSAHPSDGLSAGPPAGPSAGPPGLPGPVAALDASDHAGPSDPLVPSGPQAPADLTPAPAPPATSATPGSAVPAVPHAPAPAVPAVLSESAERLVNDLAAFEAAFGAAFGAEDGDDVRDFDGRGFDR